MHLGEAYPRAAVDMARRQPDTTGRPPKMRLVAPGARDAPLDLSPLRLRGEGLPNDPLSGPKGNLASPAALIELARAPGTRKLPAPPRAPQGESAKGQGGGPGRLVLVPLAALGGPSPDTEGLREQTLRASSEFHEPGVPSGEGPPSAALESAPKQSRRKPKPLSPAPPAPGTTKSPAAPAPTPARRRSPRPPRPSSPAPSRPSSGCR